MCHRNLVVENASPVARFEPTTPFSSVKFRLFAVVRYLSFFLEFSKVRTSANAGVDQQIALRLVNK